MSTEHITFIGAGNMARALISALIAAGHDPQRILASDPGDESRAEAAALGIGTTDDNAAAVADADTVVLAVKPQVMDQVLASIAPALQTGHLVISVAAGVTLDRLRQGLGERPALVRAMPNTPALYGAGVAGLVADAGVKEAQRNRAEALFRAAGAAVWIDDEALMDAVTAVSGSGPAYFFLLTEALTEAGRQAGLDAQVAARLARQTAVGAGVMLAEAGDDAGTLRRRVTSPGGTTAAALEALESGDFAGCVRRAVEAAVARGRELGS